MTNKEIARAFNSLAKIMELHDENPYRIRSYANAYIQLRKVQTPLIEMTDAEIGELRGVGKAIAGKIRELESTGTMETYETYKTKTPSGIVDLLQIKGFGPKKIRTVWKELGVESVGELLYACNENRLVELKGFGLKTQAELKKSLEYFLQSQNKFHYASLEERASKLKATLEKQLPNASVLLVGEMARNCPVVDGIEFLIASDDSIEGVFDQNKLLLASQKNQTFIAKTADDLPVKIHHCQPGELGSKQFRYSSSPTFIQAFLEQAKVDDFKGIELETEVFEKAGIPFILPEMRDSVAVIEAALNDNLPDQLIETSDIKGILHCHSTYSDGLHTLEQMAKAVKEAGYEYLGITDHSKAAFYANGLKPDRVLQQMEEIEQLNQQLAPFKIFKGIESDILNDGSLDYEEDLLKKFDFIVASVHTNLKMDEVKATARLIKAVENPHTTILGHPTGRLLLARKGYPIDHKKVIDACAANGVSIELNANPHRLDIDWSWIPYALEKGVKISINPDAHSMEGIEHVRYGVLTARKGGLTANDCLNALDLTHFKAAISG